MPEKKDYDVIISGTGPAGLQAAIHAARKKVSVLVLGKETQSNLFHAHVENFCCIFNITGEEMLNAGTVNLICETLDVADTLASELKKSNVVIYENAKIKEIRRDTGVKEIILQDGSKTVHRFAIKKHFQVKPIRIAHLLKEKSKPYVFCPKGMQVCLGQVVQGKKSFSVVCVSLRFIKNICIGRWIRLAWTINEQWKSSCYALAGASASCCLA
jgi:alkyl hydroperoxide reductase subunit AhpF